MEAALTQSQSQYMSPPVATTPQPQSQSFAPPDPNLMLVDPAAYQQQLLAYQSNLVQASLLQGAMPLFQNQATMARELSRMDPRLRDVWDRYGPEIDAQVANVDPWQRTKQLYDTAAELVRGRHVNEIASQMAERIASQRAPALEGAGTVNASSAYVPADPIDALFAENHPAVQHFKDAGLSASDVRAHAARMGHDPQTYADMIRNSRMLSSNRPLAVAGGSRR